VGCAIPVAPRGLKRYYCASSVLLRMKMLRVLIGEGILLFASILIFRSLWTLLDQFLGYSYLVEMLLVGIVMTIVGLVLLNREVECEMKGLKNEPSQGDLPKGRP